MENTKTEKDTDNELIDLGELGTWSKATLMTQRTTEWLGPCTGFRDTYNIQYIVGRVERKKKELRKYIEWAGYRTIVKLPLSNRLSGKIDLATLRYLRTDIEDANSDIERYKKEIKKIDKNFEKVQKIINPKLKRR